MRENIVSITADWKGGTVVEAKIRDFTLLMDAPPYEKEDGKSMGPSATETFLVALGRCIIVSTLKAAKALGVKINSLSVEVKMKVRELEPGVWCFEEIVPYLKIDTDVDKRTLGKLLRSIHKYCAVGNAIKEGLIKDMVLETPTKQ